MKKGIIFLALAFGTAASFGQPKNNGTSQNSFPLPAKINSKDIRPPPSR